MAQTHGLETRTIPWISEEKLQYLREVAINDGPTFRRELEELVRASASQPGVAIVEDSVVEVLRQKAAGLKAETRWEPSATEFQRGRALLLHEFTQSQNLPLAEFARLAHKSRQQIYKDIAARRLLALNVGVRRQRLPDWQLDPTRLQLTRAVLAKAGNVDAWTVFHALSDPMDGLEGQSPVNVVRPGNVDAVADAVLSVLGIH